MIRAGRTVGHFNSDLIFVDGTPTIVVEWEVKPNGDFPFVTIPLDPTCLPHIGWDEAEYMYELPVEDPRRWRQANANQSPQCVAISLSGRQLAPFGQSSGAVLLENIAAVELTVLIEMVVNRSMSGRKLLQSFDLSKPGHRALSSSKRLM